MPFNVTMPKLSPTMLTGTIARWHVKENEHVEAGDLLLEIATDKATVEYNALDAGWLKKIIVQDGQEAEINQVIAIFTEEENESIEGFESIEPAVKAYTKSAAGEPAEVKEQEVNQPKEKAQAAISARIEPIFIPEEPLKQAAGFDYEKSSFASPLAKKLAKDQGLDLNSLQGSGPGGRIVSKDLEKAQKKSFLGFGPRKVSSSWPGSYEEKELSPIRKVIAQRLQESKSYIPHFYVEQTIYAAALVALREQLAAFDQKLSVNDFIIRACALALRQHPEVNSGFNSQNRSIISFQTIDISIAVSVEAGLITPIVRQADCKNLGEIAAEVRFLAKKAREGKLAPEEYKGGSFTISNLGMYGITSFQAIINPPQAAILAVGAILDEPVVCGGVVTAGKVMRMILSCDHRVIDGALAALFLKTLKLYLENPACLLLTPQ